MDRIHVASVSKGMRLLRAAYRPKNACVTCSHAACVVPATVYEVTGKRSAPKGERVYIRRPHGSGAAIVADANGFLDNGWTVAP